MANNPINASDPTGHRCVGEPGECLKDKDKKGAGFSGNDGSGAKDKSKGCGGAGQRNCDGTLPTLPTIGDGLYPYHTSFQMFQVTDPYYYGGAAQESYTGFSGSGESSPGIGDVVGLANDFLLGIRNPVLRKITPYDQDVNLFYQISYQNIPRADATRVTTITGLQVINNSKSIPSVINYSISINKQIDISVSAAPGETVNVNLPTGLDIYYGGVDVQVVAFTGCTGPCITIQNPLLYRGYTTTTFSP